MGGQGSASQRIERRQLLGEAIDVAQVVLGDGLDLPAGPVGAAATFGVGRVALHRAVLGMDVQLDTPARVGHGQVEVHRATVRRSDDADLVFDRNTLPTERVSERDLGMRLLRTMPRHGLERPTEPA